MSRTARDYVGGWCILPLNTGVTMGMSGYISFVHTSDWEPNVTLRRVTMGSLAAVQRIREALFTRLEEFLDRLIQRPPALFLHAGDFFQARVDTDALQDWTVKRFDHLEEKLVQLKSAGASLYWATGSHDEDVFEHTPELKILRSAAWKQIFRRNDAPGWKNAADNAHRVTIAGFGGMGGAGDRGGNKRPAHRGIYREGPVPGDVTPMIALAASEALSPAQWSRFGHVSYVALGGLEGSSERRSPRWNGSQIVCVQGCPFRWKDGHVREYDVAAGLIDPGTGYAYVSLRPPSQF